MAIDRAAAATAIDTFLRAIGRDPATEPDLVGTGARVTDAYVDELCAGYAVDTRALLEASAIADTTGGMVVVRDVAITTMCPHHLLPASGTATIAMHTRNWIVGLGTLVSLVEAHARRLTLQERIGEAAVADITAVLEPEWVACRLVLVHGCMVARGERAVGSRVETIAVRAASSDPDARSHAMHSAHAALGVGR
jgi:GTP cyclohydrolase I